MNYFGYIYKIEIDNINSEFHQCYYYGMRYENHIPFEIDNYWGSGRYLKSYKKQFGHNGLKRIKICECYSLEELKEKEAEIIGDLYITDSFKNGGKCLNLMAGGLHIGISNETREKIKIKLKDPEIKEKMKNSMKKIRKDPNAYINSKEYRNNLKKGINNSKKFKNAMKSLERSEKISKSLKGKKFSDERKKHIKNGILNSNKKKLVMQSKEYKEKISKINKISCNKPETKEKMKNSRKDKLWWNNGVIQTMSKECPGEGWIRGILHKESFKGKNNGMYNKKWYNNGIISKVFLEEEVPLGWKKGRIGWKQK